MITWLSSIFLVVGFVFLCGVFGLPGKGRKIIDLSFQSLATIRSTSLSDSEKESALRDDAKLLIIEGFKIGIAGLSAVFLPFGVLWLLSWFKLVSIEAVLNLIVSPIFIALSCIVTIPAIFLIPRQSNKVDNYSTLEKVLHRLAFKTYSTHVFLADIETRIVKKRLSSIPIDRPVFITALPRAGTTLLLECCAQLPDFASHCYRDMPFVLTPYIWSRFSHAFRKETSESRERAHGDGMLINTDSPEALEEILWVTSWKSHYRNDRIIPWKDEINDEFTQLFQDHIQKIILVRREDTASSARYISKNNGNIARTAILRRFFKDSIIIIPFRNPVNHVVSLLGQHMNFLEIHRKDPFASEYMRSIGHFDFGCNLCPIDFENWLDARAGKSAEELTFWMEYWIAAYSHLLGQKEYLHFFDYESFCEQPEKGLGALSEIIGTRYPDVLLSKASSIRKGRQREVKVDAFSALLLKQAEDLYASLKELSCC